MNTEKAEMTLYNYFFLQNRIGFLQNRNDFVSVDYFISFFA